jgi:hypothetical protein
VESLGHTHRAQEVRNPPGDDIQSFWGPIFSSTVIRSSLEARALSLGQFLGDFVEYSHQGEFSSVCNSWHEFPELHFCQSILACVDRPSSSDHGYLY